MRFKPGMLGVLAVTLALVGMLLGSWAMSMDVTEEEVTKYNALTEIGGLFNSEKTPTFTEYNPSTNYTGYYTSESVINGEIYFDGVDYSQSNAINQYRLKLPPAETVTNQYTLQDSYTVGQETYDADDTRLIYQYIPGQNNATYTHTYSYTVYDLAVALGYTDRYLTITSTNTPTDWSDPDDRFILFAPAYKTVMNVANERVVYVYNPSYTIPPDYPSYQYEIYPILGCVYDQTTNTVNLYYDVDLTEVAFMGLSPTDVYIWFDDLGEDYMDNRITVVSQTVEPARYMDPSKGVELE